MINESFGITLKLYYAKVIAIDTEEQTREGAIQFKIEPIHSGYQDAHLPFAYPLNLFSGASAESGITNIPIVDSFVWVTKLLNKWFYVFDARTTPHLIAEKYYDEIQDNMDELDQITAPDLEYPDAISFFYESGICVTYSGDSENPIYSVYHPSGSYIIIDKNGNLGGYSAKEIEFKNADGVQFKTDGGDTYFVDGNDNKLETKSDVLHIESASVLKFKGSGSGDTASLRAYLEALIDEIIDITTEGAPPKHAISADSVANLQALKNQIGNLLKSDS